MMELRWLTRDSKLDISEDYTPCYAKERVLQYRQMYNATVYAGMPGQDFMNQTAKMVWSDWKDVPEVTDE